MDKQTLDWPDLWQHLGMTRDNGNRWVPKQDAPQVVKDYLSGYRAPSRAWPNSYATPLLTKKFAKHLKTNAPELAKECGLCNLSQKNY